MRTSSSIITVVMLLAFGAMFFAADAALKPLAKDGQVGRDVARQLEHEGRIQAGSAVRVRRIRAASCDLADEGQGLRVHLVPADAVRGRPGALRHLAHLAASSVVEAYASRRPDWIEVVVRLDAGDSPHEARRFLRVTPDGLCGEGPPLPPVWPPLAPSPRK